MVAGLRGEVLFCAPNFVELDVNGVVYGVHVPAQIAPQKGEKIHLCTVLVTKEEAQTLFGFWARETAGVFRRLLKINGVGPKAALAILSVYDGAGLAQILHTRDTKALQKVPNIGAKLAAKILLDLEGYFAQNAAPAPLSEACQALESLGFKRADIQKIFAALPPDLPTETLIKEALKRL